MPRTKRTYAGKRKKRRPERSFTIPILVRKAESHNSSSSIFIALLLILLAFATGVFARFHGFPKYDQEKLGGLPVRAEGDPCFYIRLAEEHLKGNYAAEQPDYRRDVPDWMPYPKKIPLLSYLGSCISKTSGFSVCKIAYYLPPILASLCAIPVFLIGRKLSGNLVGFCGAILAVTAPIYLSRTVPGRFDTDCLNLFFVISIGYCLLCSWEYTSTVRGYIWIGAGGGLINLFYWWYGQAGFLLIFLLLFSFTVFLFRVNERPIVRSLIMKCLIFVLCANPLQLAESIANITTFVKAFLFPTSFSYGFPNTIVSVGEAMQLHFREFAKIANNIPVGVLCVIGFVLLINRVKVKILFLLPAIILGFFSFRSGSRFAMYLTSFLGMGLGYLAQETDRIIIKNSFKLKWLQHVACTVILVVCWFLLTPEGFLRENRHGHETSKDINIFESLVSAKALSENGYVWTWWDTGYAIEYLAKKSTYIDGGNPSKAFFVGRSLITEDPLTCNNIILGVTNIGMKGIHNELQRTKQDNPEQIIKEIEKGSYNKSPQEPVYLMFTIDMIRIYYWFNYFGNWDFIKQKGAESLPPFELIPFTKRDNILHCNNGDIDFKNGLFSSKQGHKKDLLDKIIFMDYSQGKPALFDYPNREGPMGVYVDCDDWKRVFLIQPGVFKSVFIQMYLMKKYDPELFELVYDNYPYMMVYQIKTIPSHVDKKLEIGSL